MNDIRRILRFELAAAKRREASPWRRYLLKRGVKTNLADRVPSSG